MGKYRLLGTFFDRVFRNDLNANFEDVDTDIQSQKKRVDDLIVGTPQPSEVVDARGGFPVLRDRLDDVASNLAQTTAKTEGVVSVTQYAVGDYVAATNNGTDDTLAIRDAISATPTGGTLLFPASKDFKITDTITINKDINVIIEGNLYYAGAKNKPALEIVPSSVSSYFRKRKYVLSVLAVGNPTLAEWADDNFIGIKLHNMIYCNITIKSAERFGIGVLFGANTVGFAWNEIYLGRFRDNREQMRVESIEGGWPNANNVYGGSIELSGNFLNDFTGTRKYISFKKGTNTSNGSQYGGNAWFFYSPRFEGGGEITSGDLRVFAFDDLYRNIKVSNARFEYVGVNNISKSSIVYIEKPSLKANTDIKINGYFTYVVPYVQTSDGNPLPLSDVQVTNYAKHTDGNPWQQMFYSNLADHYFYGVNNGLRYTFDNMYLFSTNNAQYGLTSFYDNSTDPMDYTTKKYGTLGANGVPSLKISVKKGDRFKIVTDGRYQVALYDTTGTKMNMPLGTEIIATRNGHFSRLGGSYVDIYQSDVVGFNEVEVIVNSDSIGFLILGASNGNSYFDVYKSKENTPNTFDQVKNYHSTAIPTSSPKFNGHEVLKVTPTSGSYIGWVGVSGVWKGFGMIEA